MGGLDSSTNHAATDIAQAIDVGFDAFALNVGAPEADWAIDAIQQLFDNAKGKNFGLFFSFDFYADGDITAHQTLYDKFKDEEAYFTYGPDSLNVISTFSGASLGPDTWASFKETNNVYLIPNAESDSDYYSNPESFFDRWGDAVDGVFSWETAWPGESNSPVNVSSSRDEDVMTAASAAGKSYMMGKQQLRLKTRNDVTF